jgi:5-methyltetrahydrofolate--homocysteine methyltransferase
MDSLLSRLGRGEILVSDGAMGTELFRRGLEPGASPEAFGFERPGVLEEIALAYLEAGAEIIQTNTFGASPMKLADYGLAERTEDINENAVAAVRRAVGGRAYVSGSCGPSGRLLKPHGDADPAGIYKGFERQIRALVQAGVDLLCIETMTDLREAELAVRAARVVSPGIPVMATMTFDETRRGFFTIMGTSVPAAAAGLREAGADVAGSNCGNGMAAMVRIAREFRKATALPLLIQANAGLPQNRGGKLVYPETPEFFAEMAIELIEQGVSIIGGCCGTTPEHIRAVKTVVLSGRRRV